LLQAPAPMLKVVPAPPGATPKSDPTRFTAPVKAARQLLTNAGGDRATTLVSLDLQSLPFLQYSPGDHLMIYPENSPKARPLGSTACMLVRSLPRRARCSSALQLPVTETSSGAGAAGSSHSTGVHVPVASIRVCAKAKLATCVLHPGP
jgi:sulfite reductase alpha subunit-like flavoprotein